MHETVIPGHRHTVETVQEQRPKNDAVILFLLQHTAVMGIY